MKSSKQPKKENRKVVISKNGPYLVSGNLPLAKEIIKSDSYGDPVKWEKGERCPDQENYVLCRCGQSKNPPYCDGTHLKINFDGTETASRKKYAEQSEKVDGPDLVLTDVPELCASARFCHQGGGTWNMTVYSDNPESKKMAIKGACDCPAGRLVACDKKSGQPIEPKFKKSISLVEDPDKKVSGPIWVKGGVPIESADGTKYETRNRVTLCRCGRSANKPFCDGSHIRAGFKDGDKTVSE
jgi:CDGSH-type Zn-finger protein